MNSFKIYILGGMIFLSAAVACAEPSSPAQIKTRASQTRVMLGDEIDLRVQIDRPRNFRVYSPPVDTPISPFEIKRVELTPFVGGKNRVQETFELTLTVFQLGDQKIPPIPFVVRSESGRDYRVWTEPIPIKVVSVGKKKSDKEGQIRPIKGPASTALGRYRGWILAALCAALFIFLIVKIILRRLARQRDWESTRPADERVFIELGRLKKAGYLEAGKVKEYYSEFADILRRYLERRFSILALERTSHEIQQLLKERPEIDGASLENLKEVLEMSDLVKFAKFSPAQDLADILERQLSDIVAKTAIKKEEPKKEK